MIEEYQLRVLPEEGVNEQSIKSYIEKTKGLRPAAIKAVRVLKRSVDARQRTIFVNLKVRVYVCV